MLAGAVLRKYHALCTVRDINSALAIRLNFYVQFSYIQDNLKCFIFSVLQGFGSQSAPCAGTPLARFLLLQDANGSPASFKFNEIVSLIGQKITWMQPLQVSYFLM